MDKSIQVDTFARFTRVSRETIISLKKYEDLLIKANKSLNLIGKSTLNTIWTRHFLDSVQVIDFVDKKDKSLIDLGSGAGFPGLVLAVLALNFVRQLKKVALANKVCLFIVIALGFNYLYYTLSPKSRYLLESLDTPEQVKAWLEIYKHMKSRVHMGVVLGLLGYLVFAYGMCK